MRKVFQLILLSGIIVIESCKPLEIQPMSYQTNQEGIGQVVPETKTVINNDSDDYAVSINDAKCFLAIHRPGEQFSISPYIVSCDTLFFVVQFNNGWMVLSRDRRTAPVIAESCEGTLNTNPNSGYSVWLRLFNEDLATKRESSNFGENEYSRLWKAILNTKPNKKLNRRNDWKWVIREGVYGEQTTIIDTVPQMIQTAWGTGAPWNNTLPIDTYNNARCKTGCVAVAVTQILYYWHYHFGLPTVLSHTVSCNSTISQPTTDIGFSRGDITYNSGRWDDMALSASSGGNASYVGNFMLDIGNRVNMLYSGVESMTALDTMALYSMASYYGLRFSPCSPYSKATVKACLFNGYPVIIGGAPYLGALQWHAWIIDGLSIERQNYSMLRYCEYSTNWGPDDEVYDTFAEAQAVYGFSGPYDLIPFTRIVNQERFHMNWGDDGNGDGIFLCSGVWDCPVGSNYSSGSSIRICYFYNQ